jgi:hypothetical protein
VGAIARLGGSDVAAKIWDNGMGNNFLCSEARWTFLAIFPRGRFFLSACETGCNLSRAVMSGRSIRLGKSKTPYNSINNKVEENS